MQPFGFEASRVAVIRCKLHFVTEEVDNQWWTISHAKVTPGYCLVTAVVPMLDNYTNDDPDSVASLDRNRSRRTHVACIVLTCYLICPKLFLFLTSPS